MSDIYVQTAESQEKAYEIANYLEQRDFTVQTFGLSNTLTVDSRTMQDGCFARASNQYLIVGKKQ